jgi:hypothetical protein
LDCSQGFRSVPSANIEGDQLVSCVKTSSTTSAIRFRHSRGNGNPDPPSTWIPFSNGMTDDVRHLDSRPGSSPGQALRGMTECGRRFFSTIFETGHWVIEI